MVDRHGKEFGEKRKKKKEKLRMIERSPIQSELIPWLHYTEWLSYFDGKDAIGMAKASHA